MDRADSLPSTSTPVSHIGSNESYINHSSPHIIANEHHRHGCCNKRYHCDGSKCPDGPLLNPAIGIPLAICTAGLSSAAVGMYKGFKDHRSRKEMKKAYAQASQQPRPPSEFIAPSTIPQTTEKAVSPPVIPGVAEMDATSPAAKLPAVPEKMDDTTPPLSKPPNLPEKMDDTNDSTPSEIDSTPIDTLPRYSELGSPR